MKQYKIAEPDYDFDVTDMAGKDLAGKSFFTAEVAILKCTQGEALISINSRSHKFKANTNFLLSEAVLFKVIECSDDFVMSSCRFSIRFFNGVYPLLNSKVMDVIQYSAPDLYPEQEMEATDLTFRQLCLLHQNKSHAYRHKIVVNLVVNYILQIYEVTQQHVGFSVRNEDSSYYINYTLDSFCALCLENHMKYRNIAYYAGKLNISTRYLYKITKEVFQVTPKQVIDYYVSGTAKKLLQTTVMSTQQIADKLNFPDQSTFGQFFKRNVGMSPSHFRNTYK